MSETFNSFLKNIYISATEKIKNFFSKRKTPIKIIANIIFSVFIVYTIFNYSEITEKFIPNTLKFINTHTWESAIALFILLTTILFFKKHLALSAQRFFSSLTNKYFMLSLAGLAIIGASAALFIPSYTNWFRENDSAKSQQTISSPQPTQSGQDTGNQQKQESKNSASELRGHLLYITGGVVAVLGLIETNRKNSQDHIRQVHAARRDRYIEAVDKLASTQAAVRLGGVYALVGLANEWLDDENITQETRIKEGQVIVNNLCAYIRSPFHLVSKLNLLEANAAPANYDVEKFAKDQAELREEIDIRRTIFTELVKHIKESKGPNRLKITDRKSNTNIEGWKAFSFNFNKAPIFYDLNASAYENLSFAGAIFYIKPSFEFAIFNNSVSFRSALFTKGVHFYGTEFKKSADFSNAYFNDFANFKSTHFSSIHTDFNSAQFKESADFSLAFFEGITDFSSTHFHKKADFMGANFKEYTSFTLARIHQASFGSTVFQKYIGFGSAYFEGSADFYSAKFKGKTNFKSAHFKESAYFRSANFKGKADFKSAHFEGSTDFYSAKFKGKTNFKSAHFEGSTDFYSAKFKGKTNFKSAHFKESAYFDSAHFAGKTNFDKTTFDISSPYFSIDSHNYTVFSYLVNPEKYIFTVSSESTYPITTEKIFVADGRVFDIPAGCELFDPEPLPVPKPEEKPSG